MKPQQKGLMIAAPHSGSGKTVITLALVRALKLRGIDVRAAKAGPDYIDPAFHEIAGDMSSINLDPWAMSPSRCRQLAKGQGGSHLLVESMMGLYDGAADGSGSGAELAATLGIPVVLVIDAAKQSHSVGALVRGFRDHRAATTICAVILNKVGSERHETMLRQAMADIEMPVIGAIRRSENLSLPERHLGLVQAGEISEIKNFVNVAADEIDAACDMRFFEKCFQSVRTDKLSERPGVPPPGQNIHIARDSAFSFIYPHLLQDWRTQGAQISFFSPLANEGPGADADAVILPGGYPELHAAKIAAANSFLNQMLAAKKRGALIYAECGGYMVLGRGLVDDRGERHKMLGLLDLETSFQKRKLHLGYREVVAENDFFAGQKIMAHEFHYTSATCEIGTPLFVATDATGHSLGNAGLRDGNVMGSYFHMIDQKEN